MVWQFTGPLRPGRTGISAFFSYRPLLTRMSNSYVTLLVLIWCNSSRASPLNREICGGVTPNRAHIAAHPIKRGESLDNYRTALTRI